MPHPVFQVFFCFFSILCEVLKIEVRNLTSPERQKMIQIEIMRDGVTIFEWVIYYVALYVWLPFSLVFVIALYVKHWLGIYDRRRRHSQLLPSPTGKVA
jgi:ABC-type Fe3+ transport system permease subunit